MREVSSSLGQAAHVGLLDDSEYRVSRAVDVLRCRAPVTDRDPRGALIVPLGRPEPTRAFILGAPDDQIGEGPFVTIVACARHELHEDLIEHDLIEDSHLSVVSEQFRHPARVTAAPLD